MFLKKKLCGRIKGRSCADSRKQRVYISKEESSPPTVTTEGMMLSGILDAMEGRDVATVDIPGALLHADMDDIVDMRLDGAMAELLVKVELKTYSRHLVLDNGKKVLYVRLKKALYGTLKASLLFWKHLTGKQPEWGFVLNPYDTCVANKTTDGEKCTILWHVDDLKISHVEPKVVDEIIELLHTEYGKDEETPLTVNRGLKHDYLGMQINYSTKGEVVFTMFEFIKKLMDEIPEEFNKTATAPAAAHLFETDDEGGNLNKDTADLYHHLVAMLLYLAKSGKARPADGSILPVYACTSA